MWLMIAIQTIGAIDIPGHGPRKMPAPRTYVAVVVLWSIFGLMVDIGWARAAKAMAWVTVLTALLLPNSPSAKALIGFMKAVSSNFGTAPPPQGATTQ